MHDPYHSDPWLKRGRSNWRDSEAKRNENRAAMRATRKRARRLLKQDTQADLPE